ncbi:MAG: M28 family peptidase [Gemmatimonadota bacterium]|nr:M28 family peptidase [Gemmatimonadota bacterium]
MQISLVRLRKSMRHFGAFAILVAGTACTSAYQAPPGPTNADSTAILRDIAYLASDQLEGRLTGTPGNDSAAAYLARRYKTLGLVAPLPGYLQPFEARSAGDAHAGRTEPRRSQNVIALVRGRDPVLREEYIVVGAHFDHLGRSTQFAQDPDAKDAIRNGADDNASGTAAVLELARLFSMNPPRRSVIFANFSGEELGLLGSQYFVAHSPVPIGRIVAMLNFDMVGRLQNDRLTVYGTATATEFKALLDSANAASANGALRLTGIGDGFGPSDQSSFYAKDIPVLHFFTNQHEDYHRATDDVEKINPSGTARVVDLAYKVARSIAERPSHLTFVKTAAPVRSMSRQGSQTYLGSVPDMAATDVAGLRLMAVRPASPADKGGLKAGDVIVEFGGKPVKDLYSYTDALYAHKPDDVVKVVVMRDGKRVELSVTLGRRGG